MSDQSWESVHEGIETHLCSDEAVEFVVAFGSWVDGSPHGGSDIDIAVQFAEELDDYERFRKRCFFSAVLQQEDAPFVDLADIESLPLPVAHDAINGRFLCGDRESFRERKADIETRFDHHEEAFDERNRAVIERIASEGLRG